MVLKEERDCLNYLKERLAPIIKERPRHRHTKVLEDKSHNAPYQMVDMMTTLLELSGKGQEYLREVPPFHVKYSIVKR